MTLKNAFFGFLPRLMFLGLLVLAPPALFADNADPSLQWMEDLPEEKQHAMKALIEHGRRRMEERQRGTLSGDEGVGKAAARSDQPTLAEIREVAAGGPSKKNDSVLLRDDRLRERYASIEALAQDDPTDENVRQWLLAREVMAEKNARFEATVKRLLGQEPGSGLPFSLQWPLQDGLSARDPAHAAIPDALLDWATWSVGERESLLLCTWRHDGSQTDCAWPGRLSMTVSDEGADFSLDWETQAPAWLELPGDRSAWPMVVKDGDTELAVVMREGRPQTFVAHRGSRIAKLSGRLQWRKRPESIQLPAQVVLSGIHVDGQPVDAKRIDDSGRLWLSAREGDKDESDSTVSERIEVYRLIEDGRPMRVTTRIELDVSGPPREVTLPSVLPDGFLPLGITSSLPARIDASGQLDVQARRGRWWVEVVARSLGEVEQLTVAAPGGSWPQQEVWAFRPDEGLRSVEISGGRSIAPRQTGLPAAWHGERTFLMDRGSALALATTRRGQGAVEDRLALERTAWLDFDGAGTTTRDLITGSIGVPGRLESTEEVTPGRIVVNGTPRYLSALGEHGGAGVMLQQGATSVDAHSRLSENTGSTHWPYRLPISGWNREMNTAALTLELPPGWTPVEAVGADRASGLWLRQWTLMEVFLVIVSVVAIGHLFGWWLGVMAVPTLVLSWHGVASPALLWLAFAMLGALHWHLRMSAGGSAVRGFGRSLTTLATVLAAVALIGFAVTFASFALQSAMFPQLAGGGVGTAPVRMQVMDSVMGNQVAGGLDASSKVYARAQESAEADVGTRGEALARIDADAKIGTGPGTPTWGAQPLRLHWDGPSADGQVSIYLLTSLQTRIARGIAAFLVLGLAGLLIVKAFRGWPRPPLAARVTKTRPTKRASKAGAGILGAALVLVAGTAMAQAERMPDPTSGGAFPSPTLLTQLGERLVAPPACAPTCASVAQAWLAVSGEEGAQRFGVRLAVHAQTDTAVALLGGAEGWSIDTVAVNDTEALARAEAGQVWTRVPKGVSMVDISGPLVSEGTAQMAFVLQPRLVEIVSDGGWDIAGVDAAGRTQGAVTLTKAAGGDSAVDSGAVRSDIPPLVHVERTLRMERDWTVETRAVRLSPADGAMVMRVALLPGESVLSEDVDVDHRAVALTFGKGDTERRWRSRLEIQPTLLLTAAADPAILETWRLDAGEMWDTDAFGVPEMPAGGHGLRQWRPWPGESLEIDVVRPRAMPARTVTIESAQLEVTQGQSGHDNVLKLDITASEGGRQRLGLPEDVVLGEVLLEGVRQHSTLEAGGLGVTLVPGRQTLEVRWKDSLAPSAIYTTPDLDLGGEAVNTRLQVRVAAERWVLWVDGPRMGPAVLLWAQLAVALLVLLAVSRVKAVPIGYIGWLVIAVGLTQASGSFANVLIAVAAVWSKRYWEDARALPYNAGQIVLVVGALFSVLAFYHGIAQGLLGMPDMHIAGNGSSSHLLNWYQDRTVGSRMPVSTVISAPMWVYRLVMLGWALLAALALTRLALWFWRAWRQPVMFRSFGPRPSRLKLDDIDREIGDR